jgi:heat shock protein HslJ
MNRSGRTNTVIWLLPLLLLLGACTEPVVVIEEPAEVETCEWLIPIGIELANDYYYTLLQTDLGDSGGDQALLPTSILALNARGADLDKRAAELECDLDQLNGAVAAATSGLESSDPVVNVFLEAVRGGVVRQDAAAEERTAAVGSWVLTSGVVRDTEIRPATGVPITLVVTSDHADGSTGCNLYGAGLELGDGQWTMTELEMSAADCLPDELLLVEGAYLDALLAVDAFSADGDVLTLSGLDAELRFARNDGTDSAGE